jgi:hypothetical protein
MIPSNTGQTHINALAYYILDCYSCGLFLKVSKSNIFAVYTCEEQQDNLKQRTNT